MTPDDGLPLVVHLVARVFAMGFNILLASLILWVALLIRDAVSKHEGTR